jgi:superfamily II DNA/RNA helicase
MPSRVSELRWLVLDEADRLLDMGFEAKVRDIVGAIRGRQSGGAAPWRMVLLSATLHSKLDSLANMGMKDPEAIGGGRQGAGEGVPGWGWAG